MERDCTSCDFWKFTQDEWVVTIAQLITLIFKDHSAEKIQKLVLSQQIKSDIPLPSSSDDDVIMDN